MKIPTKVPEKGFYYHYKHDPSLGVSHHAYEYVGVGCNTEDDCDPRDANMVIYRPIYKGEMYNSGKLFVLRPLEMFMEMVTKDGKTFSRFQKITDSKIIEELKRIKAEMYE
jgi:hypothetical protein